MIPDRLLPVFQVRYEKANGEWEMWTQLIWCAFRKRRQWQVDRDEKAAYGVAGASVRYGELFSFPHQRRLSGALS